MNILLKKYNWNVKELSLIIFFVISVVLAMLFCVLYKSELLLQTDVLSQASLSLIRPREGDRSSLFLFVLNERIWTIPLLFLASTTYLALPMVHGTVIWLGISFGTVLSVVWLRYGVAGMFFLLLSGVPQYILYLPAWLIALKLSGEIRKPDQRFFLQLVVLEGVVILGCFLETFINSLFLEKLIKIFIGV